MNCKPNVWTLVIQHSPDTMQFAVSCHKDLTEFGWILQRCTLKIQCINFLGNGLKTILNFCDGSKSIFIHFFLKDIYLPLVLWQCWLSVRKSIRPVKNWMMRCIWSSWCHCHPIIFCFIKIQIGLTFLVPGYPGCPEKEAIKWVCLFFWETVILLFHHPDATQFAVICQKDLTEFGLILQRCTLKIQCISLLGNVLKKLYSNLVMALKTSLFFS